MVTAPRAVASRRGRGGGVRGAEKERGWRCRIWIYFGDGRFFFNGIKWWLWIGGHQTQEVARWKQMPLEANASVCLLFLLLSSPQPPPTHPPPLSFSSSSSLLLLLPSHNSPKYRGRPREKMPERIVSCQADGYPSPWYKDETYIFADALTSVGF